MIGTLLEILALLGVFAVGIAAAAVATVLAWWVTHGEWPWEGDLP